MTNKNPGGCCGGVSSSPGVEPGGSPNSPCWGFTGGVTAHQGHVMPNPRIVLIYWDPHFFLAGIAMEAMDQFVSDLASGGYWDGLGQYGVGRPSFDGHLEIDFQKYPTPNSQNPGQAFSESQMQDQLIKWLDDGVVGPPAGDETDLVYLIFAPLDTLLSLGGQTGNFCGYHQHGKYKATTDRDNLIWATVQNGPGNPYKIDNGGPSYPGQNFVDSISFCVSHELSEAFSNPDGQGYSNDNPGCEIGDLCEAPKGGSCCTTVPYTASGRTYNVETYWSNVDGKCISGASTKTAVAGGALTCFGVGGNATRVYYLDASNNINELAWVDRFVNNVVATSAARGTALTCFGVGGTDTRLYYLDQRNNVTELAWVGGNNPWAINHIPGAVAAPGTALTCFGVGGTDTRLYYLDQRNNVTELAWVGGNNPWAINHIPGAVAAPGSALTCFGVGGTDTRLYYLNQQGSVVELAWVGGNNPWAINHTGAVAAPGSALTCFGVGGNDTRVYYLDASNNINELAWVDRFVNNVVATSAARGTALTCFGVGGTDTRLYYLNQQGSVVELAWVGGNNPWAINHTGAVAAPGSALTCFGVGGTDTRLYYLDSNTYINELAWANGWQPPKVF